MISKLQQIAMILESVDLPPGISFYSPPYFAYGPDGIVARDSHTIVHPTYSAETGSPTSQIVAYLCTGRSSPQQLYAHAITFDTRLEIDPQKIRKEVADAIKSLAPDIG